MANLERLGPPHFGEPAAGRGLRRGVGRREDRDRIGGQC
jgi:hypothetical protein